MTCLTQCFLAGHGLGASARTQLQSRDPATTPGMTPSSGTPDGAVGGITIGVGGESSGAQAAGLPYLTHRLPF